MAIINELLKYIKSGRLHSILLRRVVRKEGGDAFSLTLRETYAKKHGIHVGYGSYGGCFNSKNIPPNSYFGNYCSIGRDVKIFRANHPYNYFTTHPLFYNPAMGYVNKDTLNRPSINIGNDVWIGDNVIITPSVLSIGNGAIIGAGSIVTKDVLPYSIMVGNPAKLIKSRFDEHIIDQIEESQWWLLSKDDLIRYKCKFEEITNGK